MILSKLLFYSDIYELTYNEFVPKIDFIGVDTVFPHILSAEIILFWIWSQYTSPKFTVHKCTETTQGRKLFKVKHYMRKYGRCNFQRLNLTLVRITLWPETFGTWRDGPSDTLAQHNWAHYILDLLAPDIWDRMTHLLMTIWPRTIWTCEVMDHDIFDQCISAGVNIMFRI